MNLPFSLVVREVVYHFVNLVLPYLLIKNRHYIIVYI